ncbi:MAG: hypothetical protein Q9227_008157, partial [Pyrenula ochraceoflavens]
GAVFLPTNVEDISKAVSYASAHNIDMAVCGGGHSTSAASSTDGGLLISLTKMRACTCDPDAKTITAQGGALWEDVDKASQPFGLATVGGTVHHTGIGGLTLGGGIGWLTYKHGLTIDNLLSCTVVLASGEIVTATPDQHSDLFWALCGAGQNFGVAIEFVYRAYPQTDVFGGWLFFTPDKLEAIVETWNNFYPVMASKDVTGSLAFARSPQDGSPLVMVPLIFHGNDETIARENIKPFHDVGPVMDLMKMITYREANTILSPPVTGYRVSMKGNSFIAPLRAEFVRDQYNHWAEYTMPSKIEGSELTLMFFEWMDRTKISEKGFAASSFANRGMYMDVCIGPFWLKAEDDAVCRQWARDRSEDFEKELERSQGTRQVGGENQAVMFYGNYDQYETKSKTVFGSNYPRLQQLKAIYDPKNMFNKLHPITPATMAN